MAPLQGHVYAKAYKQGKMIYFFLNYTMFIKKEVSRRSPTPIQPE